MFFFEKWFFDCQFAGDVYFLCFFTHFNIAGITRCNFSYTLSSIDSATGDRIQRKKSILLPHSSFRTESWRGKVETTPASFAIDREMAYITASDECIEVSFRYPDTAYGSNERFLRLGKGRRSALDWYPICASPRMTGFIKFGDRTLNCEEGNGYIDYVSSTIFPLFTPVSELFWGRCCVHEGGRAFTFTYTVVRYRGKTDGLACIEADGKLADYPCSVFSIGTKKVDDKTGLSYDGELKIEGGGFSCDIQVKYPVSHDRFITVEAAGSRLAADLLQSIAKAPRGIKFEAEMKCSAALNAQSLSGRGTGIHEYVLFG